MPNGSQQQICHDVSSPLQQLLFSTVKKAFFLLPLVSDLSATSFLPLHCLLLTFPSLHSPFPCLILGNSPKDTGGGCRFFTPWHPQKTQINARMDEHFPLAAVRQHSNIWPQTGISMNRWKFYHTHIMLQLLSNTQNM